VIHFSRRLPEDMAMNDLARLLDAKRREGSELLDLTESNPTRAGISWPPGVLEALSDPQALRYEPDAFGLPAAREAVAAAYGVRPERVAMTASTSEAYSWLFKLLCDPGDEVLIPRPSYPLFDHLAALESVRVRQYGLFFDHGWFIDFHTIEQSLNQRTRAIVLVNPNNPTGHFIRRHECKELLALASSRGIAVISDEVFREYEIAADANSVRTLDGSGEGLVFTFNGLSKAAGLPQMKLAWLVASGSDRLVSEAMTRLEIIADTFLSAGAPIQWALAKLLELRHTVQDEIRGRLRKNLATLAASKARFYPVEAGWTAVLRGTPDAIDLLRERNVLVQPGYFYDFENPDHTVVSLLTKAEVFSAGMSQIT
jgi:aspartate/methionine/tyrosine aminotransferase